jgi:hypothetical protein
MPVKTYDLGQSGYYQTYGVMEEDTNAYTYEGKPYCGDYVNTEDFMALKNYAKYLEDILDFEPELNNRTREHNKVTKLMEDFPKLK